MPHATPHAGIMATMGTETIWLFFLFVAKAIKKRKNKWKQRKTISRKAREEGRREEEWKRGDGTEERRRGRGGRGGAATERNCRHYKFDMLFSSARHSQGVLRHFGAGRRVNRWGGGGGSTKRAAMWWNDRTMLKRRDRCVTNDTNSKISLRPLWMIYG